MNESQSAPETTVLLVQDGTFLSETVVETLSSEHNMRIHHAETAKQARSLLATESIDCIVSNLQLPDSGGIEFLSELSVDLPIVLFTSDSLDEVAKQDNKDLITAYASKIQRGTGEMYVLANRINLAIDAYAHRTTN